MNYSEPLVSTPEFRRSYMSSESFGKLINNKEREQYENFLGSHFLSKMREWRENDNFIFGTFSSPPMTHSCSMENRENRLFYVVLEITDELKVEGNSVLTTWRSARLNLYQSPPNNFSLCEVRDFFTFLILSRHLHTARKKFIKRFSEELRRLC